MSDVNAAAERADAILAGIDKTPVRYDDEWPGVRYERNERPLALLSDAYELASWFRKEHPADDGDAIDIVFVQSLGLPSFAGRGYVVNEHLSIFNSRSGWHLVAGINGADDSDDSFNVVKLTTRGQLRRLIAAIG